MGYQILKIVLVGLGRNVCYEVCQVFVEIQFGECCAMLDQTTADVTCSCLCFGPVGQNL